MKLAQRLAGLEAIGVGPDGVNRLAWTDEAAACAAWFSHQAVGVGLRVESDPAGNLWALPDADPPWWGIGSHLDSVRGGGRYDGPLGVACAFEVAALAPNPVAVISFADEEGARFNTPTFGSKALTGRLAPAVLDRRDEHGVALRDAMRLAGVEPNAIGNAPKWLSNLRGFMEIHIDQSTDLARAGEPVGIVSGLVARARVEVEVVGRADHAGTTPASERRDALFAAARLIVAAHELGLTASRIVVEPNAATTIAAHARLWIDVRSPNPDEIDVRLGELDEAARRVASESRTEISLELASRSDGRRFSGELRERLAAASELELGHRAPELPCFAGHDAGILAERIPAAMVLVRNPTGVSHSPAEEVDLDDAAIAVRVVERALRC